MRHNAFRRAIEARQKQIGLWLGMGDAFSAELCSDAGFDWLVIDAEHGPFDNRTILSHLQALHGGRAEPVVRLPVNEAWVIKRALDLGARTLLIPMIETPAQAASAAASVAYPPHGIRGVSSLSRASRWGRAKDYLATARDDLCLLLQLETTTGLEHLEAIASTPGVDGLFIGPSDLAASMGHPGQPQHPDVQHAIEDAIRRIHATGLPSGILTPDTELAQKYIDLGCSFVAVGSEIALLRQALDGLAARFGR